MSEDEETRVGVSWMQVAGSALAAVSSAVVLSTLGVAGTVVGAAVGSVVATIGTTLYTRTLDVSRQQVAVQTAALRRVTRARSELDEVVAARRRGETGSDTGIARAERELDEAEEVLAATPSSDDDSATSDSPSTRSDAQTGARPDTRSGGRPAVSVPRALAARLSWKRLAVLAAAVFLVAMVAITAFEVVAGRAVSEVTGGSDTPKGSTVPGLGRDDRREPTPSEGSSPTQDPEEPGAPSDPASEDPASEDPSETGSPTSDPTATTAPSPTETPVPTPSPTPDLTEAPTTVPSPTAGDAAGG